MIEFWGVSHSVSGPSGSSVALDDVTLRLERGEAVAVMGANGSGKSTLCRCANGLLVPEGGCVVVDGMSTGDAGSSFEIRQRVGMIFQDPSQQLVAWTVEEEIAFGLENLGASRDDIEAAVGKALAVWGLSGLEKAHPRHLSGGQMVSLAIASVMAMNPSYLVVDEAGSLLDREGRRRLVHALGEARVKDVGVLWVTQHPDEALCCDRLLVLCQGRIVCDGAPQEILSRPADLRAWGLEPTPAAALSESLLSSGVPLSRVSVTPGPLYEDLKSIGLAMWPATRPESSLSPAEPMLLFKKAGFGYEAESFVFSNVSFDVRPEEGVGVIGPSGSGKSTLALVASGALVPSAGTVRRRAAHGRERPHVGLCSQFSEEQFCASTVGEEVAVGLRSHGLSPRALSLRVEEVLHRVGLDVENMVDRCPLGLSEGEKKKVALASALAVEESLLVLDEPTLGLDGASVELALEAVRGHMESGAGALVVSHSGDFLFRLTRRILSLEKEGGRGQLTWHEAIDGDRGLAWLPEGQLLELLALLGVFPQFVTLRSLESVATWLEGLLKPSAAASRRSV